MKLVQLTAKWNGNWTSEQRSSYSLLYGDDRESWPQTSDKSEIVIDLERVVRFNEGTEEATTCIQIGYGNSFIIDMPYEDFKNIIQDAMGVKIINYAI